jgi:DNA-nicking Smr family endonuclease
MTDQDKSDFMESLGGIRRLSQDRIDPYSERPKKPARVAQRSGVGEKKLNRGLPQVPESTLQSWFHHGLQKKMQSRIRNAQIEIDASLDLHGYRQHEALQELESFFAYASQQQARFLLIVHGKGYGSENQPVLKPLVQHWLSEQEKVLAWCPAQPIHGGSGASYVYLKTNR